MPMRRLLTKLPMLFGLCLLASACASHPLPVRQNFPPTADLVPASKPQPTVETLTSSKAGADLDAAIEAWGEGEARRGLRLCRWAVAMGLSGLTCPTEAAIGLRPAN